MSVTEILNKTNSLQINNHTQIYTHTHRGGRDLLKRTSKRTTGRKMGRQIQHSVAKCLKKQRWKKGKTAKRERGGLCLCSLRQETQRPAKQNDTTFWVWVGRGQTAQSESTEKWPQSMWETEADRELEFTIMRGTDRSDVLQPLSCQSRSKKQTWNLRLRVSNVGAMMCPFSKRKSYMLPTLLLFLLRHKPFFVVSRLVVM